MATGTRCCPLRTEATERAELDANNSWTTRTCPADRRTPLLRRARGRGSTSLPRCRSSCGPGHPTFRPADPAVSHTSLLSASGRIHCANPTGAYGTVTAGGPRPLCVGGVPAPCAPAVTAFVDERNDGLHPATRPATLVGLRLGTAGGSFDRPVATRCRRKGRADRRLLGRRPRAIIRIDDKRFCVVSTAGFYAFSHLGIVFRFHLTDPTDLNLGARRPRDKSRLARRWHLRPSEHAAHQLAWRIPRSFA